MQTVFDMIYPIGSVYVSMLGTQPPFAGDYGQLVACTWKRIDSGCTLWSTASADLPDSIASATDPADSQHYAAETLPKLPPMQCVAAGGHRHYYTHMPQYDDYDTSAQKPAYGYCGPLVDYSKSSISALLSSTYVNDHTHSVSYTSVLPSAYQENASVRPRGFKCSMWVRVA